MADMNIIYYGPGGSTTPRAESKAFKFVSIAGFDVIGLSGVFSAPGITGTRELRAGLYVESKVYRVYRAAAFADTAAFCAVLVE
jgi:hypothetical protein